MQLRAGARLGPYEITAPIGAGGMGEVYRARDTRLDRSVAIKVLSSALVATPESKARFEREARAISQLNHPQICTLHDIGHHEGTDFLVMEFLEGETLAERLRKGPMALPQLLKAAGEIASALERAHRSGIVHRDLKPGNIMLTKSGAKLLDFGLAKPAVMGAAAGQAPLISAAPTMSSPDPQLSPLTSAGALVGTMQYMSPEQLQGHEADARSDIFAFGAVVYEMATGKRAFEGKSQISVASAILESEPKPISEVSPVAPAGLDRLVRHCLEKNPEERLQSARDIEWAIKDLTAPAEPDRKAGAASWMWLAVGAVVILLVVAGALVWRGSPKPQRTMRFSVALPVLARSFALSSDGEWIAMIAPDEKTGRDALFVNQVGSADVVKLAETEGATYPFWSPDGKQIAFFADGWLKKIARAGGPITQLAKAQSGRGGSWGSGGVIVFSPQTGSGVWRVGENGGNA